MNMNEDFSPKALILSRLEIKDIYCFDCLTRTKTSDNLTTEFTKWVSKQTE